MGDLEADGGYRAVRDDVGAVWLARDFIRLEGPDAVTYLQGQLSQDVAALPVGGSALSFLLQPQGKVDALVRVTRVGDDAVVIDVDAGWGDAVTARLTRFKLRSRFDVTPLDWRGLGLRGPRAHAVPAEAEGVMVVGADWPGLPGVDLLGPDPHVPDGVPMCAPEVYEAVRIEAGVPVMGAELDERTIPQEAGIVDRTVSFTKGCYTGQELVARLDARGNNVPRHLRLLVLGDAPLPPAGAALERDGKSVGSVTSAARSPERGAVALAYVRRDVGSGDELTVSWDGGEAPARVESLPLVS